MFKNRQVIKELERLLDSYKDSLSRLQAQYDSLKHEYDTITNANRDVEFEIDFDKLRVFSIERSKDHRTVIGYLITKYEEVGDYCCETDTIKEWYFDCSQAQHNKLVDKFLVWKRKDG